MQRDIADLERAGFPLISESRNGTVRWKFIEGFRVETPVSLTLSEQMALYFSRGLFRPLQGSPIYDALESAMQKVGSAMPPQGFHFLNGFDKQISVRGFAWKDYGRSRDVIAALTRAVFHRFTVAIEHRGPRQQQPMRRLVNPFRLWYVNNGLYLVGFDHDRQDLRVFAVDRILSAKPTNRRFEVPEDFDFESFTQTAFQMIWGEPQEVVIRFSARQAPYIKERTWHPSQELENLPGGRLVLRMRVADVDEVKRWLVGFGAEAEVVEPKELQQAVRQEFRQGLSRR